jgi:hypothetical protein
VVQGCRLLGGRERSGVDVVQEAGAQLGAHARVVRALRAALLQACPVLITLSFTSREIWP